MADTSTIALIGGDLALDFANTAGLHASEAVLEHLLSYGDLIEWARRVGTITAAEFRSLRDQAAADSRGASRALSRALELREQVYRAFTAIAQDAQPASDDIAALHAARVMALRAASPHWKRDEGLRLSWPSVPGDFDRPLYPVMLAASALLESPELARIRQCGNDPCGWLFVDRSRSGTRQWCSSGDCGNLTRVRRFRARKGG
jgi:predicted RNA-binding Zn ribbon-like protein